MRIRIEVDTVGGVQQVVRAWSAGDFLRGFERLLRGRDPWEAPAITERLCGICPTAHAVAASLALESASGASPTPDGILLRNLMLGANFLDSHLLHFYQLTLLDFINGPSGMAWQPEWLADRRCDAATTRMLIQHYAEALQMRRKTHDLGALAGGRMFHGGAGASIGRAPGAAQIAQFKMILAELVDFICDVYIEDVETLALKYPDYLEIGAGARNLLAFGGFDLVPGGAQKLFRRGRVFRAAPDAATVDLDRISHEIMDAWSSGGDETHGSWLRAPRYAGAVYEVGPLARMWINGTYTRGVSVMDRHRARAYEAWQIAMAMQEWIKELKAGAPVFNPAAAAVSSTSMGLTEAPRGALGHWVQLANRKISRYQILTPTSWNASARDASGKPGPLEKALAGTPVRNLNEPVEVLRVIHSFDPCLDCAVHVMRPGDGARGRVFGAGHPRGSEKIHARPR